MWFSVIHALHHIIINDARLLSTGTLSSSCRVEVGIQRIIKCSPDLIPKRDGTLKNPLRFSPPPCKHHTYSQYLFLKQPAEGRFYESKRQNLDISETQGLVGSDSRAWYKSDSCFLNWFYWSIVDLQCCVHFFCREKWVSYTCIHSFPYSFPRWFVTGHWR